MLMFYAYGPISPFASSGRQDLAFIVIAGPPPGNRRRMAWTDFQSIRDTSPGFFPRSRTGRQTARLRDHWPQQTLPSIQDSYDEIVSIPATIASVAPAAGSWSSSFAFVRRVAQPGQRGGMPCAIGYAATATPTNRPTGLKTCEVPPTRLPWPASTSALGRSNATSASAKLPARTMGLPQIDSRCPHTMDSTISPNAKILPLAIVFEGGLGLAAIALGWLVGQSPTGRIDWSSSAVVIGCAASLPLLVALVAMSHSRAAACVRLQQVVQELIVPLFEHCGVLEILRDFPLCRHRRGVAFSRR